MVSKDEMTPMKDGVVVHRPVRVSLERAQRGGLTTSDAGGGFALVVADRLVAEISPSDAAANMDAATRLGDRQLAEFAGRAARRLAATFESGMASADLAEVVADAAALFFMTLAAHGVNNPQQMAPCTVVHDGGQAPASMLAG